jgi:phage tail sheath gpL-like
VVLETELATRWLFNNMQDGMVVTALRGSEGALTTWLNTRNSPHVHTITTTKDATSPWETAAMAGAAIESSAATDPAVGPTAKLLGYKGPVQGDHFTIQAINNLLVKGGSSLNIAPDYTGSLLRMVTNYKLSAAGAPDRSMAEMCWLKTMSYYRWFVVTEFQNKYNNQGYKLAQYVLQPIPGQKIMTVDLGQEVMLGIYKLFMDAGLTQNMDYYQKTLLVEVDSPNGKLKIVDEPVILTQHYQTEVTSYVVAGQV